MLIVREQHRLPWSTTSLQGMPTTERSAVAEVPMCSSHEFTIRPGRKRVIAKLRTGVSDARSSFVQVAPANRGEQTNGFGEGGEKGMGIGMGKEGRGYRHAEKLNSHK